MELQAFNHSLYEKLVRLKEEKDIPGFAAGIVTGDGECECTKGVLNMNNPVAVDGDSLFQIASVTKTFTALLVLLLQEEGHLNLDRPVKEYIPGFAMRDPAVEQGLTIRHLLTHTGGWEGDILEPADKGEDSLREAVRLLSKLPQLTPLGKVWAYNPSGFYILGYLLELVMGKSYAQLLREYVLQPLKMEGCVFTASEAIIRKVSVGHYTADGVQRVATPWELPRFVCAGAGLVCTLRDLMRYLRFLLAKEDTGIFPRERELKSALFGEQCRASGPADTNGLSWMLRYVDGLTFLRHGGASFGQYAELVFSPEHEMGAVILANGDGFVASAADLILTEYLGVSLERTFPAPVLPGPEICAEYCGRYGGLANDIDVYVGENGVQAKYNYKKVYPDQKTVPTPPPPFDVIFYDADRAYLNGSGTMCDFIRDDRGKVAFLRHGNRIHVKEA